MPPNERRVPRRRSAGIWRAAGLALLVLGLLTLAGTPLAADAIAGLLSRRLGVRPGLDPQEAFAVASRNLRFFVVGIGVALAASGVVVLVRSRRLGARDAGTVVRDDPRPPVLYLRSFKDDALAQFGGWEEQFATVLQEIGPVIAVGRPGETLPPLGAARTYLAGDDWQRVITEWLPRAALVVVRLGETEGVRWELEQAAARVGPERLLLVVPAEREAYARVRDRLGRLLPRALPAHDTGPPSLMLPARNWRAATGVWLVCFRADGTPRLLGLEDGAGLAARVGLMGRMLAFDRDVRRALRPVFDQLHVAATPPVAPIRRALVVAMPTFAVLLVVVFWNAFVACFAAASTS